MEKTRIISFTRFRKHEETSFEFLGFEYRWGVSHTGKDIIKRQTTWKKLKKSLANFKNWCKESRNKRLWKLFRELNVKLRGYYNYIQIGYYGKEWSGGLTLSFAGNGEPIFIVGWNKQISRYHIKRVTTILRGQY